MRDNIIFAGCSFTWGQGLWSYMETTEYVPTVDEYIHKNIQPPVGYIEFRDNNRFAGIVSNALKKNQIVKLINGGTDNESLDLINYVFDKDTTDDKFEFPSTKYDYSDVSNVIFQTTQVARSELKFTYNHTDYILKSPQAGNNLSELYKVVYNENDSVHNIKMYDLTPLYCWMYDNEFDVEDVIDKIRFGILNEMETTFKFLESHGIRTNIICWTTEYLNEISNNDFLKTRLILLNYKNEKFQCIEDMFVKYPNLIIETDSTKLHESGRDGHPSLLCHKIIAESILEVIS